MTPLDELLKEEEEDKVNTKVVVEQRCQRLSGKDNIYISSWSEQNMGHIRRLDLAKISKGRVDQVPNTSNYKLHSIKCIVLILSHNCIRSWNLMSIG